MRILAIPCYLAILLVAAWQTDSKIGWLVLGVVPVLLLDRHLYRFLSWKQPVSHWRALLVRFAYVLVVALVVHRIAGGILSWRETCYLGVFLSLAGFLWERSVVCVLWLADRRGLAPATGWRRLARNFVLSGLCLILVILLLPLNVFHPPHLRVPCFGTPTDLGLKFEEVRVPTADGLELAGWFVPHSEPRGSVIFCHGHGGTREHLNAYLPALHDAGLQALALDFRGHGTSPGRTATFGAREVFDVQAAERFLIERLPDKPVFILGVSYGAAVTLQALPKLKHVRAAWLESGFSKFRKVAEPRFAVLPRSVRRPLLRTYSALVWLDCGFWGLDVNPIEYVNRTSIPILFCHGKQDDFITFAQAEELYDAYRGPKWHYWVEGATHFGLVTSAGPEHGWRLYRFFEDRLGEIEAAKLAANSRRMCR